METLETQHGENVLVTAVVTASDLSPQTSAARVVLVQPTVFEENNPPHVHEVYSIAIVSDNGYAWTQLVRLPGVSGTALQRGFFKLAAGVPYIRSVGPPFIIAGIPPGFGVALDVSAKAIPPGPPGAIDPLRVYCSIGFRIFFQNPTFTPKTDHVHVPFPSATPM